MRYWTIILVVNLSVSFVAKVNAQVSVNLESNFQEVSISNDFKIEFYKGKNVWVARLVDGYVCLPVIPKRIKNVNVEVLSGTVNLKFKDVEVSRIQSDLKTNWTFVFLDKEFKRASADLDEKTIEKLYIWQFNPFDGEGIELVQVIKKKN